MNSLTRLILAVLLLSNLACTTEPSGQFAAPIALNDIFLRPTAEIVGTPADYGYAYDELFVPIDAQRKISIWHVYAENPKAIVVIIPGSDRNKSRYLIGLPVYIPNGYDVILMDYEGFGASPGEHTLSNLLDDGLAAVDYALSKHPRVVAFGISTGASPAVEAARNRNLAAVILEASLVLHDEPELYLRYIGLNIPLLWDIANAYAHPQIPEGFDILSNIGYVDEPKLVMHSTEDDVTTFEAGLRVFTAAVEPKGLFVQHGAHGAMISETFDAYRDQVIGWLDSKLAGSDNNQDAVVGSGALGETALAP
jgi:uncharacterized protein